MMCNMLYEYYYARDGPLLLTRPVECHHIACARRSHNHMRHAPERRCRVNNVAQHVRAGRGVRSRGAAAATAPTPA